jgi:geranylgeranyl pyrophosphate synthase
MDASLFQSRHEAFIQQAESALRSLTPVATARPARLHEAMRYSLEAGGKRLRPVLCLASAAAFAPQADASHAATALECIHTYSLIHDDLPCMDDSDLRRGRPSCHKSFDEATALLAGDALQPLAFELLATGYASNPSLATALVRELAITAGSTLLVGGQTEDMGGLAAGGTDDRLEFILLGKTAAMLSASFAMGAMIGGASAADVEHFRRAGRASGIAFQLVDDLLDLTADATELGKPVGADAENGKSTYTAMHGVGATKQRIEALTIETVGHLRAATKGDTTFLVELVRRMSARRT